LALVNFIIIIMFVSSGPFAIRKGNFGGPLGKISQVAVKAFVRLPAEHHLLLSAKSPITVAGMPQWL